VLASVIFVPIALLVASTGRMFGAGGGSFYALTGPLAVAEITYSTPRSFADLIGIEVTLAAISVVLQRFLGRRERAAAGERQRNREALPLREHVIDVEVEVGTRTLPAHG
jgi:phospholipase D1/2